MHPIYRDIGVYIIALHSPSWLLSVDIGDSVKLKLFNTCHTQELNYTNIHNDRREV